MQWPLDVRKEERRTVFGAFFALFGMTAAHSIVETARDALFLARVPVARLVWVYLAIAAIAGRVGRLRGPRRTVARSGRPLPALLRWARVTVPVLGPHPPGAAPPHP